MPAERRQEGTAAYGRTGGSWSLAGFRLRLLLLAALVLLPLYIQLISGVFGEYAAARGEVRNEGLRVVRLVALQQEHAVAAIKPLLSVLSRLPDVVNRLPTCSAYMERLLKDNPGFGDVGVAGPDGVIYCAGDSRSLGVSAADKSWFTRALSGTGFAAGDYDVASGKQSVGFGLPFDGPDGSLGGVVYATQDLDTLNEIAMRVSLPADSVLTVVDRGGTILSRYPDPQHWVGKTVPDAPLVQALRGARLAEGVFEAPGLTGVPRLFAFTQLDPATASSPYVTIGYARDVLLAGAKRDFMLNLFGLAALTLIVLLLAWSGGNYLIIDQIRALQDVERIKAEFVSIASHQLRTPITSLRWANELLMSGTVGPLTPEQSGLIGQTDRTLKDLQALANDLLQVNALDTGTQLHPEQTDLARLAREAAGELSLEIGKKGLAFSASYGDAPAPVIADPLFLKQTIMNLLANAVRYTPKGGAVSLAVETGRGEARLIVVDRGLGVPEAEKPRIFERFFRASNVRSRHSAGSGLGLYLAKAVVERSGGRIGFSSRENEGSTFWFSLPLSKPAPAAGSHKKRA